MTTSKTSKTREPPTPSPSPPLSFTIALTRYLESLDAMYVDSTALLPMLLAHDEVEPKRKETYPFSVDQARCLIDLDTRLHNCFLAYVRNVK